MTTQADIRDRITELRRVPASSLRANPKNWRQHPKAQQQAMAGILREIGYADALLARETPDGLELIDGHLRAETTPDAMVPVLILDVTEDEADKILLTLDPLAAMATANKDALQALLESVHTTDDDVQALLDSVAQSNRVLLAHEGLTDPDDVPDVPDEPTSKLGDLWLLGEHRLLCGDATNADDVGRLLDGNVPGAIVTDPPYGMHLDTDWSGIRGTDQSLGFKKNIKGKAYPPVIGDDAPYDPAPMLDLLATEVGEVFLFGPDYYAERIPDRDVGSWMVWDKRKESQADGFGSEFELIWSRQRHKKRVLRHEWFGFLREGEHNEARSHPTQKPVTLITDIIEQWCPGAIVADPYAGSGTTLIACERLGRRCYAMEIEPRYVDVAVRRWEQFTGKTAVLDG